MNSLNEDELGEPCAACADRLLETLPGVFHRPWMETASGGDDVDADDEASAVDEMPEGAAGESPSASRRDHDGDGTFVDPDQPA